MPEYLLNLRNRELFVLDIFILLLTPYMALVLRLDTLIVPGHLLPGLIAYAAGALLLRQFVFYRHGLYRRYWAMANIDDMLQVAKAVFISAILLISLTLFLLSIERIRFARSVLLIDTLLVLLLIGGNRFAVRIIHSRHPKPAQKASRTLVYGAGEVGVMIVGEMQRLPQLGYKPLAFLDDDPRKHNMRIHTLPVLGGREVLIPAVRSHKISCVVIAIPSSSGKDIREIASTCEPLHVETKIVPAISEILDGEISVNQLRDIAIDDLLGRSPVETDIEPVRLSLTGQRVMVTGGGGSIGKELCRQILYCEPEELVVLGHGENSVFGAYHELKSLGITGPKITPVIADVRFSERLRCIFEQVKPQIVFHAAAHKHVPLMEANPAEAITNNVLGTRNLLDIAMEVGVEQFVLISTDKAVNPTSIMGASKRVAELLVRDVANRCNHSYVAVRFGNVLGSRGSVVLTFQEQIARGGPVTVTSPEARRYFMTIPEAVQLVLQASTLGEGGEVFVLDMGEPVRIVDLARDMIRLSGYQPGRDIDIEYIGLRPGEKLFEDLFANGEHLQRTKYNKILIAGNDDRLGPEDLNSRIELLLTAANQNDVAAINNSLRQLIPEYQPTGLKPSAISRERRQDIRRYSIPINVVHREVDNTAVILNGETGKFYTLDEVGTQMWNLLLMERRSIGQVIDAIVSEYDIPSDRAKQDLKSLVSRLEQNGLAKPV